MTIDEYADWAATIGGVAAFPSNDKLSYLGLGLAGEAGEVANHIKKLLRDGKLETGRFTEELGDVIYYWACLCVASGQKPSAMLAGSYEKIVRRLATVAPPNNGGSS
jgi:NTP pyrophosphatase (non-canonical NTP hydrolase)